jgi:hypothetical protein
MWKELLLLVFAGLIMLSLAVKYVLSLMELLSSSSTRRHSLAITQFLADRKLD